MGSPNQDYINAAVAAADLIASDAVEVAKIIVNNYLAVSQHIEAAIENYSTPDPRLDIFRGMGPSAALLLDEQLEDTAGSMLLTASQFLQEMNVS